MELIEQEFDVACDLEVANASVILESLTCGMASRFRTAAVPIRFVVTRDEPECHCEVGAMTGAPDSVLLRGLDSIFRSEHRPARKSGRFNAVLLVPTGIGAEIGGHAGDAGPVARLLANVCDTLITHPNVVNASDINELPDNGLYVEGSAICRLLMGTAGLSPVRSNRVLVVLGSQRDKRFVDLAVNSVNAACATYGMECAGIVGLDPPLTMTAEYTKSGTAAGKVTGFDELVRVLDERRHLFDAVAITSVIDVPPEYHLGYFKAAGEMVNPWGGVEAMLTHAVTKLYDAPAAHAPMFESREVAELDPGVVDPRMAAEAVSGTFLQCVLKGLHRSPQIDDADAVERPGFGPRRAPWSAPAITAADISCLVIPAGCLGLPTLAALEQGITVIAVKENRNLMRNQLARLPWGPNQYFAVNTYWEAAGVMAALRAGISPRSVRRPLPTVRMEAG